MNGVGVASERGGRDFVDLRRLSMYKRSTTCKLLYGAMQGLGCRPIASLDHFLPEHLANAALVEEIPMGVSKVVKVSKKPSSEYDVTIAQRSVTSIQKG